MAGGVVRGGAIIVGVAAVTVTAFAWAGGWLTPGRLSPERFVAALRPPGGFGYGDRRNHAPGVCVTGSFTATGDAASVSDAAMLRAGTYPLLGRLSLGSADPHASEATTRVRGFAFDIVAPGGAEWRSAMINVPIFPVATPSTFLALLRASASPDKEAAIGRVAAAHPEQGVRRLEDRALDGLVRRGTLQRPRRVRRDRRGRPRALRPLVGAADDADRDGDAGRPQRARAGLPL